MNKIIRIDRRNRMALIEPGVTYSQIQPELARKGLRLSPPLLPRANKSVITSLLERQPTLVPKYNWSLPELLRCLEVVWGKGLAQVDPMGPQETDWYRLVSGAQGSMGIVTWASIKCEILPKVHKLFFLPAEKLDDLIDCAYKLLRLRLGDEFLFLNRANLASILSRATNEIRALREELPPWVILIGIAGREIFPEERVKVEEQDIMEIAQQFALDKTPEFVKTV
jgi:hypothetical protein